MSVYLVEYGGAASDRAYKDAGPLTVIGPFDSAEDVGVFGMALNDNLLEDYVAIKGFDQIEGRIDSEVTSPQDRLRQEVDDFDDLDEDDLSDDMRTALDRWWPDWRAALDRVIEEREAHQRQLARECEERGGHAWTDWRTPKAGGRIVRHRTCKHCWKNEVLPTELGEVDG